MIDPSDGDILGWRPDDMAYKADASDTYRFLISLPLYAKRDIFRSMYGVLSKCSLLDVFRQPKQVKWATGIIKLGMQLPLEDISLATQAFSLYTDALFAISSLYNKGDDDNGDGDGDGDGDGLFHSNQNDDTTNEDLLDILLKPCILFNPRVFFANELPSRVVTDRTRKTTIETHESCFAPMQHNINKGPWSPHDEPMQIRGNRSTDSLDGTSDALSASSGAVDRQGVEAGDDQVAMRQHVEQASVALFSKKSLDESPHVLPGSTSQGANSISHAVKLWDKYVELLQKVLQVYSTLVRGLKSLVSSKTLVNAFDSLMVVVDMLLSQGGKNPRLKPWAEKYRLVIGPELWNKTWGTMGDRLEEFVVKLVFDIWARGMALSVKVRDSLTDKMGYWLHRESFMAAWLQVINQVSLKVLQHHYPYDDIVATDRIHLQFGDFSMSGKMSPESAIVVLERYARTRIDFDAISDHSYGIYAKQICTIVRRALNIKRLVYIKGTPFAQLPPTANYVLHYFRYPLLEVSLRKFVPSRETANVRRDVFSLVCMLLIMPSNAADPISDANRNDLIRTIRHAIVDEQQVQIVLPNVTMLLKNSLYMRPFIPQMFGLICRVLPECYDVTMVFDRQQLRRHAIQALSTLMSFISYYHRLGRSELLCSMSERMRQRLSDISKKSNKETKLSSLAKESILETAKKVEKCPFDESALTDSMFTSNVQVQFQLLLCSVITENDVQNLQTLTCALLTFLHQYSRYNSGYLLIFAKLYIRQLQLSNSYEASDVYIYGLTQLSLVTWSCKMKPESSKQMVTGICNAMLDCDRNLEQYSHWNPYHQAFIASIHCLCVWISSSDWRSTMDQGLISKVMSLLSRCNRYIRSASPMSNTSDIVLGRRIWPTSSEVDEDIVIYGDPGPEPSKSRLQGKQLKCITTVSTAHLFGHGPDIKLPNKQNKGKDQKTHALSNSLYKALSTQVYVLSTLLLRRMDNEQRYSSLTPIDMVLARMALYQNMVPNTNLLLRGCSPAIAEMLEGYIPVSVEFFSAYKRAIYSKINLKRFQDGKWSDVATLTTARYPSGSKQWVSFPSMPTNATAKPISNDSHTEGQADTKVDLVMDNAAADTADRGRQVAKDISLPWVRMSSEILYCSKLRTGFCVNDQKLACTKPIRPLIDTENESRIEEVIAEDFLLQHSVRNEPEIESTPTHPSEQRPRGNCFSRVNMQFFGVDVTAIDISAEMLATIDTMDELTRPFSAQPVVIYLHSPKSLSTDRRYAKGPLLGVSPEFKQFLESIGQSHTTPLTRLKRHPDDPTILRYTFGIDSYEIGYNLAPNVSSLLSNVPMGSRNNKVFYESVRERGIAIVWFDRHPGNLDSALTWDFLDSCEEDTNADEDYSRGASKTNLFSHRGMAENGKEQGSASTSHGLFKSRSAQSDAAATYLQGSSSQHSNRSSKSGHLKDSPHFHRSRARELFEKAVHFKHKKSPGVFERDSALRTTSEPRESGREVNGLLGAHTDSKLDHHEQQPLSMRGGSIEISDTDNMSFASDATDTSEQHHPVSQKARHEHLDHAEGDGKRDTSEPAKSTGGERTAPKIRVVIAIAPIENTNGKLVKATISATGGSEEMNNRFVQMTGPLTSSTVINIDDIALLLSATVIDAAANIASLSCDDFTAVTKRMEMIKYVITNYSSTPGSITDLHKFVFPAGTSGTANAFKIPQSVKRMSTGKKGMETSIV
ncbi:hypothetical protein LPJ59_002164 [Coemansia sp. RSA 2399]|nr:hypothetical protein LPJ59_002164 [Coemansia sp. RSA 2399]